MKDAFGRELKVGDIALVPVKIIHGGICDGMEFLTTRSIGGNAAEKYQISMTPKQFIRANEGDPTEFRVAVDGINEILKPK